VAQKVPVEAGHFYSFRINYRAAGLRREKQQPGPDRGYSCLMVDFNWVRPGVKGPGGYFRVMEEKKDSHNWVQATNSIANFWSVLKPYQAPPGTTDAIVGVHLTTLAANDLPKVWIDDLELVETFP